MQAFLLHTLVHYYFERMLNIFKYNVKTSSA